MTATMVEETVTVNLTMEQTALLEQADPYLLAPLDLSSESIRLVEILPASDSNIIKCRLRSYPIQPDCPSYIALSYMWDHESPKSIIELNDVKVPIGRNLWAFLHRMHLRGELGPFWIDAICINQSNTLERNHQVPLMRQIYSGAETVSIWLGEHVKGTYTDMAMRYLARLQPSDMKERFDGLLVGTRLFRAVLALSNHQYWTRVWIVQEVILARTAVIYSGALTIQTKTLLEAIDFLGQNHIFGSDQDFFCRDILIWPVLRSVNVGKSLLTVVFWFANQNATILHDKVYALLGLVQEQSRITVDYGRSYEEVFKELVVIGYHEECEEEESEAAVIERVVQYARCIARVSEIRFDEEEIRQLLKLHSSSVLHKTIASQLPPAERC